MIGPVLIGILLVLLTFAAFLIPVILMTWAKLDDPWYLFRGWKH